MMTRNAIQRKAFALRAQILAGDREYDLRCNAFLAEHPMPGFFKRAARRQRRTEYAQCRRNAATYAQHRYNVESAKAELAIPQSQCPHEFSPFGATQMGPEIIDAFQSRTCAVCSKREIYMDSYGGTGIG